MARNEREPHALGTRRPSENAFAGELGNSEINETTHFLQVHRLVARFGLTAGHAAVVAELAFGQAGVE